MKYEKIDGVYHVYVDMENGEKEKDVLCAIVKTSFDLALSSRKVNFKMTFRRASHWVRIPPDSDGCVVAMSKVYGKHCYTLIKKVESGHFVLSGVYQTFRSDVEEMLMLVVAILDAKRWLAEESES